MFQNECNVLVVRIPLNIIPLRIGIRYFTKCHLSHTHSIAQFTFIPSWMSVLIFACEHFL